MNQLRSLPNSVRNEMNVPSGELHIRLPIGLPPELLGLAAGLFRDRHPEVPLFFSFSEDPCAHLPADVDMLLHFGPLLPRGAFKTQALHRIEEKLMASPDYLATQGTPRTLEDLQGHPLLIWRVPGENPRALPTLTGSLFPIAPVMVSSDIHSLRMMVAAGAGIGLIPTAQFQATVEEDGLVHVLPELVGRQRALRLAIPEVRAGLPRNRAALQLIREILDGAVGFERVEEGED